MKLRSPRSRWLIRIVATLVYLLGAGFGGLFAGVGCLYLFENRIPEFTTRMMKTGADWLVPIAVILLVPVGAMVITGYLILNGKLPGTRLEVESKLRARGFPVVQHSPENSRVG